LLALPLIMSSRAENGFGRHGVQRIEKILGTTREFSTAML